MSDMGQAATPLPPKWQDVERLIRVRSLFHVALLLWPVTAYIVIVVLPAYERTFPLLLLGVWLVQMVVSGILIFAANEGEQLLGLTSGAAALVGLLLAFFAAFGPLILLISLFLRLSASFTARGFRGMYDSRIPSFLKEDKKADEEARKERERAVPKSYDPATDRTWSLVELTSSNLDFQRWVQSLDAYLSSVGIATRSNHFTVSSLAYGYQQQMSPELFVKEGYNKSADPALVASATVP